MAKKIIIYADNGKIIKTIENVTNDLVIKADKDEKNIDYIKIRLWKKDKFKECKYFYISNGKKTCLISKNKIIKPNKRYSIEYNSLLIIQARNITKNKFLYIIGFNTIKGCLGYDYFRDLQ